MIKELSHVMLEPHNVRIEPSNVRKKSKGTAQCEKRTVTCDVGTEQCENGTVKCEKKVTWYSRLPISGYRTPFFWGGTVELPFLENSKGKNKKTF